MIKMMVMVMLIMVLVMMKTMMVMMKTMPVLMMIIVLHLVVEPEDVVVNADVIELDKGLDVPKDPKHFTRSVSACL